MVQKIILITVVLFLTRTATAQCYDPDQLCTSECPAAGTCYSDEDCQEGDFCLPLCSVQSFCSCRSDGVWLCSGQCTGECIPVPEPTGSRGYLIEDLGTLGGWSANALAINNRGAVVGEADTATGTRHAFLWDQAEMIDVGESLGPPWSSGVDINNSDQIIIWNGESESFLWDAALLKQIPSPGFPGSVQASAINDAGHVVGGWFLWDGTQMITAQSFGMSLGDVSNTFQIAGATQPSGSYTRASIWDGDSVVDLGTLGGQYSFSTAINDLGQAIGDSERAPGGDRSFYPFLWTGEAMVDLGIEGPFFAASARGINNCSEVVGEGVYSGLIRTSAYIYHQDKGFSDLFHQIPAEAEWYSLLPNDINDRGEIVGYGIYFGVGYGALRAFRAVPKFADLNTDGDIDLRDFARFQAWFTGPQIPNEAHCLRADLDRDRDIDMADLAAWNENLMGPQ